MNTTTIGITPNQIARLKYYVVQILPQGGMTGDILNKVCKFAALYVGAGDFNNVTEEQAADVLDFFEMQKPEQLVAYIESSLAPPTDSGASAAEEAKPYADTSFMKRVMNVVPRGVPVTPVLPGQKRAFLPKWQESATTDPAQINAWAAQYPDHNYGCVAKAQPGGFWMFEVDASEVLNRIKGETGHDLASEVSTFMVRSRVGRGHFYFSQNDKSISMGNLSQSDVKSGDWSARVHNEYVVGPGSRRDDTGTTYDIISDTMIIEAPDWLIDWCISQKAEKKTAERQDIPRDPAGLIPHGYIHGWMVTQAGSLRNKGLGGETLERALLDLVHDFCAPPIDDSKVVQCARSFEQYPVGQAPLSELVLNQKPNTVVIEQEDIPIIPYPKFPRWVMEGTLTYENFVKPVCDVNSRIPEFMWVPSMALLLNYLYPKVEVEMRSNRGGIFLIVIGTRGQTMKSASVEDAFNCFRNMGCLSHFSKDIKTAEGKSIVWTAGSTEGFGSEMQQINCRNGVLFYDEFKLLSDKAGIESSSMKSHLLSIYEQGKFQNSTKDRKKGFSFEPGSYVGTLIACTTPKNFHDLWSTFAYGAEGMDDRFFFLLEPENLEEPTTQIVVDPRIEPQKARLLIEKATTKGKFQLTQEAAMILAGSVKSLGNRPSQRAEKWARAIAVDMGLDQITADAVRRGIAITEYELAVKKYLDVRGANSKLAAAQLKLCQLLQRQPGGRIPYLGKGGLYAKMRGDSYDTKMWWSIYNGLIQAGRIREEGNGTKEDPKVVVLLRALTEED